MKPTTLPLLCGCALAAMSAAGLSHWWSVQQFIATMPPGSAGPATPSPMLALAAISPAKSPAPIACQPAPLSPASDPNQQKFYAALIARMEGLQSQNRDLLDQLAETNRDLMKLEFRVDTHSESFRPMPVSEDRPITTNVDDEPGVLPPRAEPVVAPAHE